MASKCFIILAFLLSVFFGSVHSQEVNSYHFEHYTQDKGLSQGSGYTSVQFENFLWLGTQDGLNRFDGYNFRVYKNGKLQSNFIQDLLDDKHGHLWAGTSKGLSIYFPKTDSFQTFEEFTGKKHPLENASVRQLLLDKSGNIWILTDRNGAFYYDIYAKTTQTFPDFTNKLIDISEGQNGSVMVATDDDIFRLDNDRRKFSPLHVKSLLGLSSGATIRSVLTDRLDQLWVGTYENGLYVLEEEKGKYAKKRHFTQGSTPENISSDEITRMMQDSRGQIWIGTRTGGISIYNPENKKFIHSLHAENKPNSLAENFILSFSEDVQKNVWIGLSGGGFDKFDPHKYQFQLIQQNEERPASSLSDNMVFKIFAQEKFLYFGTQSGGMTRYDPASKQFKTYKNIPGNPSSLLHNEVYDISSDEKGKLWLALGKGLCSFDPSTQRFESFEQGENQGLVYLFAAQSIRGRNEIWAGGQRGLYRFDTTEKKWKSWDNLPEIKAISKFVTRLIYQDSESNIWFGTIGQGLFCYSPATKKMRHFDQKSGLDCANIRCVTEDGDKVWVGTDCGAYLLDKTGKATKHLSESNGLPNNVVYAILKDSNGHYWLSTNNGITHFDPAKNTFKTYVGSDGLQSNEFNTNCMLKDANGVMYFGGVKGISYFNPSTIVTNTFVPPVKITGLSVMDTEFRDSISTPYLKKISLLYDQNFISFEFSAFNFSNSEKNSYKYKLDGIQDSWVNAGHQRTAKYTNLPPGEYIFRVKGANDDGIENPVEAVLEVTIIPPFWKTWWFRTVVLLVLASIIYMAYRNRLNGIRKEERQKAEIQRIRLQAEMMALRAQINPMLVFNSLNTVDAYILVNKRKEASHYLQIFSRLVRKMLENSKHELITIKEDLEMLKLYVSLEEERYGNIFKTTFSIDPELIENKNQIPPLILQPFIENAIEYGLRNGKTEGGHLHISLKAEKKQLMVHISNDSNDPKNMNRLNGKRNGFHQTMGLSETYKRIESLGDFYHKKTSVTVSNDEALTNIDIVLPLLE